MAISTKRLLEEGERDEIGVHIKPTSASLQII